MRDGGINLRGAYVSMSQQLADRLNSYALRQGDRRGEGMAGRMECNLLHYCPKKFSQT